jgi:hypothetical protein
VLVQAACAERQADTAYGAIEPAGTGPAAQNEARQLAEADKDVKTFNKEEGKSGSQPDLRTLPPGSKLPSAADCAARIVRSDREIRPENGIANDTRGIIGADIDGADESFNHMYAKRVDGNFTGTTDEILQWGACKWGFDIDLTRARAVQESYWRQSQLGDKTDSDKACAVIGQKAPCWQSYGVLQVKGTVHERTYPFARNSTAYNVDYALAWLRACYEGAFGHWMGDGYRPGDEWGCVGAWYSGNWFDSAAKQYIEGVRQHLADQLWLKPDF